MKERKFLTKRFLLLQPIGYRLGIQYFINDKPISKREILYVFAKNENNILLTENADNNLIHFCLSSMSKDGILKIEDTNSIKDKKSSYYIKFYRYEKDYQTFLYESTKRMDILIKKLSK